MEKKIVHLKKGEHYEIVFENYATAGYIMGSENDHENVAGIEQFELPSSSDSEGDPMKIMFRITGINSGTAHVRIIEFREWEKEIAPSVPGEFIVVVE